MLTSTKSQILRKYHIVLITVFINGKTKLCAFSTSKEACSVTVFSIFYAIKLDHERCSKQYRAGNSYQKICNRLSRGAKGYKGKW